jgi:hypothetical protein
MAGLPFDMSNETNATVFFFVGRIVQTMALRQVKKWLHE